MEKLNFPEFEFRFKSNENSIAIFDILRRKFVALQPEEWVRQHTIHYLLYTKGYPKSLMNAEKQLTVNALKKRYDLVVFEPNGAIQLLVECKAPSVAITQSAFDQIARYNSALNAKYLMVTNGLQHYYCQMDKASEKYQFLRDIPDFGR